MHRFSLVLVFLPLLACDRSCPDTGYGHAVELVARDGQRNPAVITAVTWTVDGGEAQTDLDCGVDPCIEAYLWGEPGHYTYSVTACGQTLDGEVDVSGDRCGVPAEDIERVTLVFNACGAG